MANAAGTASSVNNGIKKLDAGVPNTLIVDKCKIVKIIAYAKYEYTDVVIKILLMNNSNSSLLVECMYSPHERQSGSFPQSSQVSPWDPTIMLSVFTQLL